MRQAVMVAPGRIEFREAPVPRPGQGEVLLRIRRIGICGSDVHVNHGKHPFTSYPVIQGHEFSAVVEELGPGVTDLNVGAKVTATPQVVCGECRPCRRGDYHVCDRLKVEGFQAPGVAQDYFATSRRKIVVLPDDFSFEQGALVEPIAVAVRAVSRAGNLAGKNVVVLGAGPIGNLVSQVARGNGAAVMITDVSDCRLKVAAECGVPHFSNARHESLAEAATRCFGAQNFAVAMDCAGAEITINEAIESIDKGGTIVVVAVFGESPRVNLGLVQDRELQLLGTLMYQYQDYVEAVRLIQSGQIRTEPLDSRHFPFEAYEQAYKFIDEQGEKSLKVFVDL